MAARWDEQRTHPADAGERTSLDGGEVASALPEHEGALSLTRVNAALAGTRFFGGLHHFETIGSTNAQALAAALDGAAGGQVYLADQQTAGRGRGGHNWHSEPEHGLYLTVLVKPPVHSTQTLQLSMLAGLAAEQAIWQATGLRIDLRWPNDLVSRGRPALKLGGILTEAASTPAGEVRHAAIGIGINLNQRTFPPELQATASSLRLQTGAQVSREAVVIALLRALDVELKQLAPGASGSQTEGRVFERFAQLSTWVQGKRVRVEEGDGYTGVTAGLSPEGLLRVRCDEGVERTVRHGGVREL